jgi:hypothetical protein
MRESIVIFLAIFQHRLPFFESGRNETAIVAQSSDGPSSGLCLGGQDAILGNSMSE